MGLQKLIVENFKSFEKIDVDFEDFNVLIGSNSSGKSNFVQIFKFLKDIHNHNLDVAISKQGGIKYLRNINIAGTKPLKIKLSMNHPAAFSFEMSNDNDKEVTAIIYKIEYLFSIGFSDDETYTIIEDDVEFHTILVESKLFDELLKDELKNISKILKSHNIDKGKIELDNIKVMGNSIINLTKKNGKADLNIKNSSIHIIPEDVFPKQVLGYIKSNVKDDSKKLLIETVASIIPIPWGRIITDISFYDFDPKSCKSVAKLTGSVPLNENGDNLSIILEHIINDKKRKRKFFNLLNDLLPSIQDMVIKPVIGNSRIFELREYYSKENCIPASLVSDGSSNIIALIVSLYFEEGNLIFIEEPERNIHPKILSKVVDMMKDSSKHHQIFTTTHNPEILKYTNPENIYFISRDKNGYSIITKPSKKEELKPLMDEIGIDELFIDDMLGV